MVKKWFKPEKKQRRVTKSRLDNDDGSDIHQQNDQHYSTFQANSTHREGSNFKGATYPGVRALRKLTPTKENAEAKENEKNEGEKEHISEENVDKPPENKIAKIPKPKFKSKAVEKPYLNRIDKFLTPTQPLKSLFASAVFTGEVSPEDSKTPSGDKRNASQLESPGSSPEEKAASKQLKKDKASSIPVGFGAMSGRK